MSITLRAAAADLHIQVIRDALLMAGIEITFEKNAAQSGIALYSDPAHIRAFTPPYHMGRILDLAAQLYQTLLDTPADITLHGGHVFSAASATFQINHGATITLTEKEVSLLHMLAGAYPNAVHKDDLLHHIWGYKIDVELETHTLETHIYRLRQKIEKDPTLPTILVTDKDGYRLQ